MEQVILVDEADNPIGVAEKMAAHKKGQLHRAFSVFVYRQEKDTFSFLLQQRHASKYHSGGLWTNTCCSHPRPGESVLLAAKRRLREEMSLELPLEGVGSFIYQATFPSGLIEHELDHVFIGEYKGEESILANPLEVQDHRWMRALELNSALREYPEHYTPWLKPAFNLVTKALCFNF